MYARVGTTNGPSPLGPHVLAIRPPHCCPLLPLPAGGVSIEDKTSTATAREADSSPPPKRHRLAPSSPARVNALRPPRQPSVEKEGTPKEGGHLTPASAAPPVTKPHAPFDTGDEMTPADAPKASTAKPKPSKEEKAANVAAADQAYASTLGTLAPRIDAAGGDATLIERAIRGLDAPSCRRLAFDLHVKAKQLGDSTLNDQAESLIGRLTKSIAKYCDWGSVEREIEARTDASSGDGERLDSQRRSQNSVRKHLVDSLRNPASERMTDDKLDAKVAEVKVEVEKLFSERQRAVAEMPVQLEGESRRVDFEWAPTFEAFSPGNDARACNGDLSSREWWELTPAAESIEIIELTLKQFKLVAARCNELHDQDEMRREMSVLASSGLGYVDKGANGRVLVYGNATKEERSFMAEDPRLPIMRALMQALADGSRGTVTTTTKRKPVDLNDPATKSGGHGAVRLSDPRSGDSVSTTPSGTHIDNRVSAQGDYGEVVEQRDEAAAVAAAAAIGRINFAWFDPMDEQETERLLAMLAGSHVTFFVSHLIGLRIKIHMAPGDILIMASLIRGAARRSRLVALWEHGGFANHEPEPQVHAYMPTCLQPY